MGQSARSNEDKEGQELSSQAKMVIRPDLINYSQNQTSAFSSKKSTVTLQKLTQESKQSFNYSMQSKF
jgi:hypothetical protein